MSFYEEFNQPLEIRVLKHNGFKYVKASDVRERLNKVLDCAWSFEILSTFPTLDHTLDPATITTVMVLGRLTVTLDNRTVFKDGFGSCDVRRFTKGPNKGAIIDLGMDFQTAAVSAFKACAKMLGVANNIEETEDRVSGTGHSGSIPNPESKPREDSGAQKPSSLSPDVAAKLKALKEKAANKKQDESSKPQTQDPKPETHDDQQASGFDYSNSTPNSLTVKKMILTNLANNIGTSVNELIASVYGKEVNIDNITEDQLTTIIGGQFANAANEE